MYKFANEYGKTYKNGKAFIQYGFWSVNYKTKVYIENRTGVNNKGFLEYELVQKSQIPFRKDTHRGMLDIGGNRMEVSQDNYRDLAKVTASCYRQRHDGVYTFVKRDKFEESKKKMNIKKNKKNIFTLTFVPSKTRWK